MINKLFLFIAAITISIAHLSAVEFVIHSPVINSAAPTTVSVSTSAWTEVPASYSLTNLTGIILSNISTNTASVVGMLGNSDATITTYIGIMPIEIEPGEVWMQPISSEQKLYLRSLATSAENISVQEIRQAR